MSGNAAGLAPESWRENVAAIVMDATGRVLLGLDSGRNAYWHFPQGGAGGGETLEQALARELWEEVRLAPTQYRIVAQVGGFRYKYRKGNDKSGRWRGQQQTYFLLQCHGAMPPADCSHTDEFAALTWVRWQELSPELFVPFKRKVAAQVLATFFPPAASPDPAAYAAQQLTPQRYRLPLRAGDEAEARPLFAAGKEEAQLQLARLELRLRAAHKLHRARGERLLVLLHGAEGSGRKQCLRRLAAALDPLGLRCGMADALGSPMPWPLLELLPAAGQLALALHTPAAPADPQGWTALESWLAGQGVRLLKLYLAAEGQEGQDADLPAAACAAAPWYAIPSGKRWYRDLVAATLVAEALEAGQPPLA